MPTANTVRAARPQIIQQLTIFGGTDEIHVNSPSPKTTYTQEPAPTRPVPKIETILPAQRKASPPAVPSPELDFYLPGERYDDGIIVDLEAVDSDDTPETLMAKRMFLRMLWDIKPRLEASSTVDLFGQTVTSNQNELDKLDALIWLYGLNPDGGLVTFEWVCDVLGYDPSRVRRIVGHSTRKELKRLVNLLSTMVDMDHARHCVETLSDYVEVSNWHIS